MTFDLTNKKGFPYLGNSHLGTTSPTPSFPQTPSPIQHPKIQRWCASWAGGSGKSGSHSSSTKTQMTVLPSPIVSKVTCCNPTE